MLAILSAMLAFGPCEALGDGGTAGAGKVGLLTVQRIEVQVVRSTPLQVFVLVHGFLLNGCSTVGTIEQHRDGQLITVTIPIHIAAEVCTMIAQLVDEKIRLEGEFKPGVLYTVNVNGLVKNFSI